MASSLSAVYGEENMLVVQTTLGPASHEISLVTPAMQSRVSGRYWHDVVGSSQQLGGCMKDKTSRQPLENLASAAIVESSCFWRRSTLQISFSRKGLNVG
jgi:hypothetical protein